MLGLLKVIGKSNINYQSHYCFSAHQAYQNIIYTSKNKVALITLNRPKVLNALCNQLMDELNTCLKIVDKDDGIGAIILTGSIKAFAAGADISEMKDQDYNSVCKNGLFESWEHINQIKKPIIAAVNGFALGGGCELAMLCDIIIAGDSAKFGQPEIKLGTIPGCGGTQRLIRAVGKYKAMDMILTGDMINSEEAQRLGLVSRVYPKDELLNEVQKIAENIAQFSQPIVAIAKECVKESQNQSLNQGVLFEKRQFHATFATKDRKEGMTAFVEKRPANFENK